MVDETSENTGENQGVSGSAVPQPKKKKPASRKAPAKPLATPAVNRADMSWYVLKVQTNRERTIREALLKKIHGEQLEEFFGDIIIPSERVVDTRSGASREQDRKLFPGYIMVQMLLNDETWYLVRDTGGVGDFAGAAGKPLPMEQHEVDRMLGRAEQQSTAVPKVKIGFAIGDLLKIREGTFENFEGRVEGIDEQSGKVSVLIEIFGRSTPVEIDHWQLEAV
ncbi:MAG: transcription termination/antitermination protein NusG [Planctomycetaceae bacterium]